MDSQLLYILPFAAGYAKQRDIRFIVLDKPLPKQVADNSCINSILDGMEIIYLNPSMPRLYSLIKRLWKRLRASYIRGIPLGIKLNRDLLLTQSDWFKTQVNHAIWDTSFYNSADGLLDLNIFSRLRSANAVSCNIKMARILEKKYHVTDAILGHVVYAGRALASELKRNGVNVMAHAASVIYHMPDKNDTRWSFVSRSLYNFASYMQKDMLYQAGNYWKGRTKGISLYQDAKDAYTGHSASKGEVPVNVVFLHVFRDSPFNYIDRQRVFADYIEWISCTLREIANSDEDWLIKPHPSASAWGEDQFTWLESFSNNLFNGVWPKNIMVEDRYSNMYVLAKAKRVITYHGTVHLEAAAYGIKPIVIADVTLNKFDPNYVHKPRTLEEYLGLLRLPSTDVGFLLDKKSRDESKILLYLRENLLPFSSLTGSYTVRRFDGEQAFNAEFRTVAANLPLFAEYMIKLGCAMSRGLPHSISLEYLDEWMCFNKEHLSQV